MKTRILLVDDHELVRRGIRSLLEAEEDFEVCAEASNGRVAVDLAQELKPDVVVMDIALPGLNGIEATRRIRKSGNRPEGPRSLLA
jgi:DNA-binding NarL/FixJ family response regulator